MKKKILVIGSLNMDMITQVNHIPAVGETVLGSSMVYVPGGKGANQAYAAANLESDIAMLGCVGRDISGNTQIESLRKAGVCMDFIRQSDTAPTGTALIYVNEEGDNCIVVIQGANLECDIEYLKSQDEQFRKCDFILLQMEIPCDAIYYAIRRGRELGKTILLNPAPAPDLIPDNILCMLDYITPNETELMHLCALPDTEHDSVLTGANQLLKKGVSHVIVTLGEKGVLLVDQDTAEIFPVRKVTAIDTTAAGDCFNGAFAVALSEGQQIKEALLFANIASSIAVTRMGAQSSIPSRKEVEHLLRS